VQTLSTRTSLPPSLPARAVSQRTSSKKEIAVHLNSCLRCQLRTKENLSEIAKMQTTLKKANESGDMDDKEDDVGDKMGEDKEEKEKDLVAKLSGEGAAPSNMCSCVTARDTLRHQQAKHA